MMSFTVVPSISHFLSTFPFLFFSVLLLLLQILGFVLDIMASGRDEFYSASKQQLARSMVEKKE